MGLHETFSRLTAEHRRQVLKLVLTRTLWVAILAAFLFVAADLLFQFAAAPRAVMGLVVVAGLVAVALGTYRFEMRASSADRKVARLVEQANRELRNDLVNALDFGDVLACSETPRVSSELMTMEISLASNRLATLKSLDALTPPTFRKEMWGLLCAALLGVGFIGLFPGMFSAVVPRFLLPFGDHPPYSPTRIKVTPAGASVDYGKNLKVTAETSGSKPKNISLVLLRPQGQQIADMPMFEGGDGSYFQTVENVREDMTYFITIPRGRSKRYPISLEKSPRIETVTVTYEYPPYTFLASETRMLNPAQGGASEKIIKGYKNTKVTLTIISNRQLKNGALTASGASYPMVVTDAHSVSATFPITSAAADGTFSATITDIEGYKNREPLEGKIELTPDLKPEITIVSPQQLSFAIPNAKVPINIEARDDLGVKKIELFRNHNESDDARKMIVSAEGRDKFLNVIETLDLADLGVKAGDIIEFYATATDSHPDSPQTVATPAARLAIISFEDYRDFMQTQLQVEDLVKKYEGIADELQRLIEEQKKLEKEAKQLEEALQKNGALTEREKQRELEVLQKQKKLAEQTEELAKDLKEKAAEPPLYDVEKDYKQALKELAENLQRAQQAMKDSAGKLTNAGKRTVPGDALADLKSALSDQQRALKELGDEAQNFKEGIEAVNKDIEKIAHLLEDVERFKELLGEQESLERQARALREIKEPNLDEKIRMKEMSEQQAEAQNQLDQLKKDFRKHAKDCEGAYPKVAGDARGIADDIEKRAIEKTMKEGSEKLSKGDGNGGHKDVETAAKQLREMVPTCEGAAGNAAGQCELRLKMKEIKGRPRNGSGKGGLGQTLKQLARGFQKPNKGQGQSDGGSSPVGLYGTEEMKGQPRKSPNLGRRATNSQAAAGEAEPKAGNIEEVTAAKNDELGLKGEGSERFMREYRRLIEEYFKRQAEEK